MRYRLSILAALVAAVAMGAGDQPLTIERIFADPPVDGAAPREVRWLADGRRFSLIESAGEGKDAVTSLIVEDAASGARSVVLKSTDLAPFGEGPTAVRPTLAGYRWTPAGDAVLLGGQGQLFLATIADRKVRRLTTAPDRADDARISPDGTMVAFVRANDLWILELASGRETKLSEGGSPDHLNGRLDWVYQEEIAGRSSHGFEWSPDSKRIAYITLDETSVPRFPLIDFMPVETTVEMQRFPKPGDANPVVGLAVVDVPRAAGEPLVTQRTVWSGDGAPYLARFGWAGGGTLWFQLLDRSQTRLDLWLWPAGGSFAQARSLAAQTDPAWVNLADDLRVLKDGRILWSSERSGYRHLELIGADGSIQAVTTGEWEVTSVTGVDEATGTVFFTATEKRPIERHLYRVNLDGSGLRRLTREDGSHTSDLATGSRFILDTYSRIDQPPVMRLLDGDGTFLRTVAGGSPSHLAGAKLGTTRFVDVTAGDGTVLHGALLTPADFDPARRYPVIVYVYGGPHAQVVRNGWGGRNALFHQVLASRGFLVFSLDNRGSAARGRAFERALGHRLGATELADQLAGVEWLRKQPFVDAGRLGIWGWSYGGYMTCTALTGAPGTFKAGVAVAPVTDWRLYDSIYTERYLGLPKENEAGYRDSSPVHRAKDFAGALLLAHGSSDDNVHWQHTIAFIDALYQAGKGYDLQIYPGKTHSIAGAAARAHLFRRIAEHFERHLQGQPGPL